jgi:NADPH:quinone reductase-like Zn-dependent oxidoreductase
VTLRSFWKPENYPVIDRSYPLSEIAEAFRYIEDKHAQGKVVITMERNNAS